MTHIPGLSPKVLLAAADQDFDQFFDLLAKHRPIDLVGALATTAYSLAVELYGGQERAREVFAAMALAADVDEALAGPLTEFGEECTAAVAELEAERAWDADDEVRPYGLDQEGGQP